MDTIVAIDPGTKRCGAVLVCIDDYKPFAPTVLSFDLLTRDHHFENNIRPFDMVIEKPVCQKWSGSDVSETAIMCGRFAHMAYNDVYFLTRSKVKGVLGQTRGNDATVKDYLVERFAPGVRNHGKGTRKEPGWFYGFKGDAWAAYALGVAYIDMLKRSSKADLNYLKGAKL